jgi:hypothetical protein
MSIEREPVRRPRAVEVRGGGWEWRRGWGPGVSRGGVPWLGVALVAIGVLFLAQEYVPAVRLAMSVVFLAIGVGLVAVWVLRRRTLALYAGAIITAVAAADLLGAAGILTGRGWTTVFLGLAFLFIAIVRFAERGGWGWQAWLGALLVLVGGLGTVDAFGRLGWPILIVVVGLLILVRGATSPARSRW